MEYYVGALLGGLAGLCGFIVGQRLAPKNKTTRAMQEYYEDAIGTLRRDLKSLRGKVSYYQKGAIPSDLASMSSDAPEALVDGIIQALPANWRSIVAGFKPQILAEMKKDPQAAAHIIEVIKAKVGGQGKDAGQGQESSRDAI